MPTRHPNPTRSLRSERSPWQFAIPCILVLLCLSARPASAEPCSDYRQSLRSIGQVFTGGATDIEIVGSYAYVAASTAGLVIVDISLPTGPVVVGQWPTARVSYGVAVRGHYAYVADWDAGLQIIDVSNPAAPVLAGHVDTPGLAYGVAVDGQYVYVADYAAGVQVIDALDPLYAEIVGSTDTPGFAYNIAVRGNVLYVADDTSVQIVDVSVKTLPHVVAFYDTPAVGDQVRDVAIVGGLLYLPYGSTGLQILDLVFPGAPYLLSTTAMPGPALGVTVAGEHAHVACNTRGLVVVDVSDPQATVVLGAVNGPPGHAERVSAVGTFAFVVDDDRVTVVDAATPFSVPPLGHATNTPAYRSVVAGNRAYVISGQTLTVVDITNDAAPQRLGTALLPQYAQDVALYGTLAVVADGSSGVVLVNVSNPASPQVVFTLDTPGYASGVALSGSYLFVADGNSGLRVIDLANGSAPPVVVPMQAYGVRVSGNRAYVTDEFSLSAVDITNPGAPVVVGGVYVPYIASMAIDGFRVYTAGSYGVHVVDVTNLGSPAVLGDVDLVETRDIATAGNLVYTASYGHGFEVLDVSNPAAPFVLGSNDTPGLATSISISGDRIYLGDDLGDGFSVYPLQCPVTTAVLEQPPRATRLLTPFPNPANPRVTIPFVLERASRVRLTVHDVAGREIARLFDGVRPAGAAEIGWSGSTASGRTAASGVYVIRMVTPDGAQNAKIVLSK